MPDIQPDVVAARTNLGPPPRVTRMLLWCAGADRDLLPTRRLRYRYSEYGLLLLLVGLLAGIVFVLFASVVFGFHAAFIPFGLLWGTFIFLIDRMLVSEPKHRASEPGERRRQAARYLLRIVVSIGAAVLVCEAVLLVFFSPEINRELPILQRDAIEKAADHLFQDEVDKRQKAIATQVPGVDAARTARDTAFTALQDARKTLPTTAAHTPDGDRVDALEKDFTTKDATFQQLDKRLRADREALVKYQNGPLPTVPQNIQDRINKDRGWTAREAALRRVLHEHPDVRFWPWLIRAVLVAFDLMPLLSKLLARRSLYDDAIERQESLITRQEEQRNAHTMYHDDLAAENRNAWARARHNLEQDRMGLFVHNGRRAGANGSGRNSSAGDGR
jgi:hypothetical protein